MTMRSSKNNHNRSYSVGNPRPSIHLVFDNPPLTPWRKLSTGIAQALRGRKPSKLGDRTNSQDEGDAPLDLSHRFADLIESPAQLRLMKKSELQSVAAIVNTSLPANQHINIWERNKDKLRNSIEEVFGFPRIGTPQAPRRSGEHRLCDVYAPITPLRLGIKTPEQSKRRPSQISYGSGLASQGRSSLANRSRSSSIDSSSPSSSPLASRSTHSSISRLAQSRSHASVWSNGDLSPLPSQSNSVTNLSMSTSHSKNVGLPNSNSNSNSLSSVMNVLSPSSSHRANSRHGHSKSIGDYNFAEQINAALASARMTNVVNWKSSNQEVLSPSHSRGASGGNQALSPSSSMDGNLSPSASRSSNLPTVPSQPGSNHTRSGSSSSRSNARMSWMGTSGSMRPLLDVVAESRDEEKSDHEDETADSDKDNVERPRKRLRAPEPSSSSLDYQNRSLTSSIRSTMAV